MGVSDSELEDEENLLLLLLLRKRQNRRKARKRRYWIRNIFKQRHSHGTFHTFFKKLLKDKEFFFRYHQEFLFRKT